MFEEAVGGREGIRIPEGVREVIGQRLNRLSGDCNRALGTAAVIGREFTVDLLVRLLEDLSEDRIFEVLEEALAASLIEELPPNVGRYQFTHRLVQEALIQELSLTRRVRLHVHIAGVLEGMYEDEIEAHATELAYHFTQSEAVTGPEKVVKYSVIAGDQALQSYAYEEAETHFQRALASKGGQPIDAKSAAILFSIARSIATRGGRLSAPEVLGYLERAFQYYRDSGDIARAVEVAEYPVDQMPYSGGLSDFISGALALVAPDSQQEDRLLSTYALSLYKETGDYGGAQDVFDRALAIARRENDLALEMRVWSGKGEAAWWNLSVPETIEYTRQAIELSGQVDDPVSVSKAQNYFARATIATGNATAALLDLPAQIATAERMRAHSLVFDAYARTAEGLYSTGDWEAAREFCDRGIEILPAGAMLRTIRALLGYETGAFAEGWEHMELLSNFASRAATSLAGFA